MQSQPNISPTAAPYQPSPIETEQASLARSLPRDWSVWLLPVVGVLLALSAYSLYALPTNFDLLTPIRVMLPLCLVLLAFIWLHTRALLRSASNNVVTYKREGRPVVWNWTLPFRVSFYGSMIYAALGTLASWLDLFRSSFNDLQTMFANSAVPVALASVLALLASILWFMSPSAYATLFRKGVLNMWTPLSLVLLCIISGFFVSQELRRSPSIHATSFASWSSTVKLVTHAAAQIDKDAVVEWVLVDKAPGTDLSDHTGLDGTALEMAFFLVSPNRSNLVVRALDTNPPRLERIDSSNGFSSSKPDPSVTQAKLDALRAKLAYATIGPRDVYFGTQDEAASYANGKNLTPETKLLLPLNYDWQTHYGVLAGWQMLYYDPQATGSENPPDTKYLSLYVDGNSGKVIAHDFTADEPVWSLPVP